MKNEPLTITELQDVLDRALLPPQRSIVIPRDDVQQISGLLSDETMLKTWTIGFMSGVTTALSNLYHDDGGPPPEVWDLIRQLSETYAADSWADPVARDIVIEAIHATVDAPHEPGCPCCAPWCSSRTQGATRE